jgi:hypothetical protein
VRRRVEFVATSFTERTQVRSTPRLAAVLVVLAVVMAASGSATAAAQPPSAPCSFSGSGLRPCASVDPQVTKWTTNSGDTSACNFAENIYWGDGSSTRSTFAGSSDQIGQIGPVSHIYSAPGTYSITSTGAASGGCSITGASLQFTLLTDTTPAVSGSQQNFEGAIGVARGAAATRGCAVGVGEENVVAVLLDCPNMIKALVSAYRASHDPPDPNFRVVFKPQPLPVPALGRRCARLRGASCRRLKAAELQYLQASAKATSLSEAVGVTADRFGGARAAGDLYGEYLQRAAEANYLPLQTTAIGEQQQAGRQLGALLKRDHLNIVFSAKQVAQGRKRIRKLHGIPRSMITGLERDGLITSRNDLARIIASVLKKAPRARATTLAQVLGM